MILTLYKTTSAPNTLNKQLTQIGTTKALKPTQAIDVLSPDIIIGYAAEYLDTNICYIDTFKRYYFCKPEIDIGGRLILHCAVDVLTTYRDKLLQCSCNVIRNENVQRRYMIDKKLPVDSSRYWIEGKYLPNDVFKYGSTSPTAQYKYILLVNGD